MGKTGIASALAGLILATAVEAHAQNAISVDLFGSVGVQRLWDDESSLGAGLVGGGGVGFGLGERVVLRGRVVWSANERDFDSGVVFEATTTRYTADGLWRFSSSEHSAYVGAGAGGLSFTRTSEFPSQTRSTFERSDTDFVFGGIGGFTAFRRGRFAVNPEASFWWSQPNNFIGIDFSVLASVRF